MRIERGGDYSRVLYAWTRSLVKSAALRRRIALARELEVRHEYALDRTEGFKTVYLPNTLVSLSDAVEYAHRYRELVDIARVRESTGSIWNLVRIPFSVEELRGSPVLTLALEPAIVHAIANYLRIVPLLWEVELWVSTFGNNDREHPFHCDWADTTQVRVLINVTETNVDNGAMVVIPATVSGQLRHHLRYRFDLKGSRVSDETILSLTNSADLHTLLGPAGMISLVDTSRCFHYGSRIQTPGTERVLLAFTYYRPTGFRVSLWGARQPYKANASSTMCTLQRMVLGAD